MTDQELAERLARIAAEMESLIEPMHARGSRVDARGQIQEAFVFHRFGSDLKTMARQARYRAIVISREAAA